MTTSSECPVCGYTMVHSCRRCASRRSHAAMIAPEGFLHKTQGRMLIRAPDGRTMYRARLVVEQHLGRRLASDEHVHHINGDKLDDQLENLRVMSPSEHSKLHANNRQPLTEAMRANIRAGSRARWAKPEEHEKTSAGLKRAWAARGALTDADVADIRGSQEPRSELSQRFGVSEGYIGQIRAGSRR